jgi:dimethylglycine dehydrogenase
MHFPYHEWPAGRGKKISSIHSKLLELGGVMGAYNGWERVNWFATSEDDISLESTHTWNRKGPWERRIKEECEAVRDSCGVLNLPGFARFILKGMGASEFLRGFCTGGLPKIGRMNLIYVSDKRGRILTEMSCIRLEEESFILITAATAQWHDKELIQSLIPNGIYFEDITITQDTLIVTGPQSRNILSKISNADFSLGWLTHQAADVAGKSAYLLRVSFAGELGWEIHASNENMPCIYQSVLNNGAVPFGMYALNSLRLEKGYRAWKGDLSTDYSLFEGGLDRFVKLDKPQDFIGKAALMNEKQQGSSKKFVTLIVEAEEADAPYMSTIWKDGEIVGETTSGGWGYRVNASIALGMIKTELAFDNSSVEVEIYGKKYNAIVQRDEPIWDPRNERLKA